jgi:hypothetical protein
MRLIGEMRANFTGTFTLFTGRGQEDNRCRDQAEEHDKEFKNLRSN